MFASAIVTVVDRRDFLVGGSAAAVLLSVTKVLAQGLEKSQKFKEAFAALVAGKTAEEGKLVIDVPETVENGNFVSVAIEIDSPMTVESHVRAFHLLSTSNPNAAVAVYRFSLQSGKAKVTSRMRLAKTQEVYALAEMSDGTLHVAKRTVDVSIGGCGG